MGTCGLHKQSNSLVLRLFYLLCKPRNVSLLLFSNFLTVFLSLSTTLSIYIYFYIPLWPHHPRFGYPEPTKGWTLVAQPLRSSSVSSRSSGWPSSQCRGVRCIWSWLGHRGLLEWWYDPWSSSWVWSWDFLFLRCNGNARIAFPMKQGIEPSSWDEQGKPELFLSCGTLGVPLEWTRVCRGTSWVASRVSRTLSRLKREGVIYLETPQQNLALRCESTGFSQVAARNMGVLSS